MSFVSPQTPERLHARFGTELEVFPFIKSNDIFVNIGKEGSLLNSMLCPMDYHLTKSSDQVSVFIRDNKFCLDDIVMGKYSDFLLCGGWSDSDDSDEDSDEEITAGQTGLNNGQEDNSSSSEDGNDIGNEAVKMVVNLTQPLIDKDLKMLENDTEEGDNQNKYNKTDVEALDEVTACTNNDDVKTTEQKDDENNRSSVSDADKFRNETVDGFDESTRGPHGSVSDSQLSFVTASSVDEDDRLKNLDEWEGIDNTIEMFHDSFESFPHLDQSADIDEAFTEDRIVEEEEISLPECIKPPADYLKLTFNDSIQTDGNNSAVELESDTTPLISPNLRKHILDTNNNAGTPQQKDKSKKGLLVKFKGITWRDIYKTRKKDFVTLGISR